MKIVAKFGGSVLAEKYCWEKVLNIVTKNPDTSVVVLSALGKRFFGDKKVTDLLFDMYDTTDTKQKNALWQVVCDRYIDVAKHFGVKFDGVLDQTKCSIQNCSREYAVSRGEYLAAKLFSVVSGFEYLEAEKVIKFDCNGCLLAELTQQLLLDALRDKKIVLGGFYGGDLDGKTVLFDRGGSDITGALAAAAINADLYENWTDVNGFFVCDPRVVFNPVRLRCLSYRQLKILSTLGAGVLHADSVCPVLDKKIPINIKSVFRPCDAGTLVTEALPEQNQIVGITARKTTKLSIVCHSNPPCVTDALFCCQNIGFCEYFFKDISFASKVKTDGASTVCDVGLMSVAYCGLTDMSQKICQALELKKIPHRHLCQNEFLTMTEIGVADIDNAIRAVYKRFFE